MRTTIGKKELESARVIPCNRRNLGLALQSIEMRHDTKPYITALATPIDGKRKRPRDAMVSLKTK